MTFVDLFKSMFGNDTSNQSISVEDFKRSIEHKDTTAILAKAPIVDINGTDDAGKTPLMLAVGYGNLDVVSAILERNPTIDATDSANNTALNLASKNGNHELVDMLLKYGADVNTKDKSGITPLIRATYNMQLETVNTLMKYTPRLDLTTTQGNTALSAAAYRGSIELLDILLTANAEVNVINKNGVTPLMMALKSDKVSDKAALPIVQKLIEYNADANVTNKKGKTALQIAQEKGFQDIVEFLSTRVDSSTLIPQSDDSITILEHSIENNNITPEEAAQRLRCDFISYKHSDDFIIKHLDQILNNMDADTKDSFFNSLRSELENDPYNMYRLYHAEFNNNQDLQKELRSKLQDQYNGLNVIERGLYSIGLLIQRWVVYPLLGNNEEPLIDQSTATTDPIEEFEEPLIDQSTATTDPIEEDRSAMGKDGIIEVSVPE